MLNITSEKQLKVIFKYDGRSIINGLKSNKNGFVYHPNYELLLNDSELLKDLEGDFILRLHALINDYERLRAEAKESIESREQTINALHNAYMKLSKFERYLIRERMVYKTLWKNVCSECGYSERQARKILHKALDEMVKFYNFRYEKYMDTDKVS